MTTRKKEWWLQEKVYISDVTDMIKIYSILYLNMHLYIKHNIFVHDRITFRSTIQHSIDYIQIFKLVLFCKTVRMAIVINIMSGILWIIILSYCGFLIYLHKKNTSSGRFFCSKYNYRLINYAVFWKFITSAVGI